MKLFLRYIGLSLLCVILIANTGCGKEDAIEVQQDLYEVIVDKPVVRIGHNEEVNVNVMLGNGGYSVKSYNEQVATATVDGEQITIKSGIQNGATTVEVTDAEGIKTDISVNVGLFELEFNEQTIEMEVNEEKELIVTMGNFSSNDELTYAVKDETVISVENTDKLRPYYTIRGLKIGETAITFTDAKGKQATVSVKINPVSIDVSNLTPKVGVNNKIVITVEKGNGGYTMEATDNTIVRIEKVDDNNFSLLGLKAGTTDLTVSDQEGQELTLSITVSEADKVVNLGSNNSFEVPFEIDGEKAPNLTSLNSITFEARIKIDDLNGSSDARINTVMGIENIFLLRVDVRKGGSNQDDRYLQLAADDKGGIRYESTNKIEKNKWYNVAVVLDGSKTGDERIALYINGVKENFGYTAGNLSDLSKINLTENFYIGQSDGKRWLNGSITYARIWDKALNADEISNQNGLLLTEEKDGLVANWIFSNGNGNTDTFVSLSGNAFEAKALNMVSTWTEDPILTNVP